MRDCRRRKKGPAWVRRHRHRSEFVAIVRSLISSPSSPVFTHRNFVLPESVLLLRTPLSPLQSRIRTQPPELMVQSPLMFAPQVFSVSLSRLTFPKQQIWKNKVLKVCIFMCSRRRSRVSILSNGLYLYFLVQRRRQLFIILLQLIRNKTCFFFSILGAKMISPKPISRLVVLSPNQV